MSDVRLHNAIMCGDVMETVKMVKRGCDVNALSEDGWTPLCCAAWTGNGIIIAYLIRFGADINKASQSGWAPLHFAARHGHVQIVSSFLENASTNVDQKDNSGRTPLIIATQVRDKDIVIKLLTSGKAGIDAIDSLGRSALSLALTDAQHCLVEVLVEYGADILASGDSLLSLAARCGDQRILELITRTFRNQATQNRFLATAILLRPLNLPVLTVYEICCAENRHFGTLVSRHKAWQILSAIKHAQ